MPKTCRSAVTEKSKKLAGPQSRKVPKPCRSTVTEKCPKLADLRSRRNAKNPQVCGHRNTQINFPGCRRKEMKKCISQHFGENAKNAQVRGHGECYKTHRSTVTDNAKNSQKMPKFRRSVVNENVNNSQVCDNEKCLKFVGPRSQKYASKLPGLQ